MSNTASSSFLDWINPWRSNKEKRGRDLREQIGRLSKSSVLDDAGINDDQVLALTREDLSELFPGLKNFQLRKKIMELITDAVKDSPHPGPETFGNALKYLMQHSNSSDAAVQDVLRESLRTFREVDEQLKAAQASLKPYIDILNGLCEVSSLNKGHLGLEAASNSRRPPHFNQTNPIQMTMPVLHVPSVKVHLVTCGRTLGADRQILTQLKGVKLTDETDCQLILLFCPVVSRAGTDIEEALRNIPGNKDTILVVMHHTHNPSYVCPSPNVSSSLSSQANIVGLVNVLFHDTAHGLLTCPANETAVLNIQSVLNQWM